MAGKRAADACDAANRGQHRKGPPLLVLRRRLGLDFRPLHLPPEPQLFGGHTRFTPDDGGIAVAAQGESRRNAGREPGVELHLDGANRLAQLGLKGGRIYLTHRCHRNL
jgi:hypothetical protein